MPEVVLFREWQVSRSLLLVFFLVHSPPPGNLYSTIKMVSLPPNITSLLQPLDQEIIVAFNSLPSEDFCPDYFATTDNSGAIHKGLTCNYIKNFGRAGSETIMKLLKVDPEKALGGRGVQQSNS